MLTCSSPAVPSTPRTRGARRLVRAGADGAGRGPAAGAVAVRGGRIVAVGQAGDRDLRDLAGPRCEVVDLAGRALIPGFQDAHVHPAFAGVTMIGCNLIGAATLDEALARIAGYARAHPDLPWIAGAGWRMEWFEGGTPGRELLDTVTGGRAAFLLNRDTHGAWASTRALELAGLDAGTPDPPDGRIERDAAGAPQGTLHEGAATLVGRHVPATSAEDRLAGLLLAQRHLHARGVTAWQDAIVGDYLGALDPLPVYLAAARSGQLTARVRGALWWDRGRGGDQLDELLGRARAGRRGPVHRGHRQDHAGRGGGELHRRDAGALHRLLRLPDHRQRPAYVDPGPLREQVTRLDAAGFQVHFHAIGDRAVRESLDAVQAARTANGPNDHRHHIAHLQVMHPDDVPRFAALGVTANMQALWAAHEPQMDKLTIPFIGPERAGAPVPVRRPAALRCPAGGRQ